MTVDVSTLVTTAARLMAAAHIHRLLVTEDGKLAGVVSLTDVARLVGEIGLRGEPAPDDAPVTGFDLSSPRDLVAASLARSNPHGELAQTFYERFIVASPTIARHFAGTDMARQRAAITAAFQLAMDVTTNEAQALRRLAEQAERHDRRHLDIHPELYDIWLNSLLHAVGECDPQFGPLVEQAWRIVMGRVIDHMRRRWM